MATVQPLDHIDDAHWQAIFQTRYAHVTRIVRTYKDKLPLVIGGNMRRTTRQRRLCGKGQCAIVRGDTIRQDAKLRANTNIEITFVRADHHRLHLPRHIDNLCQRQCAFMIQVPDVNLLALRAGDINCLLHECSFAFSN